MITNAEQSLCVGCSEGSVPSDDRLSCVCETGYYDTKVLPAVDCFDIEFFEKRHLRLAKPAVPSAPRV